VQKHFPDAELKSYQTSDESYQDLAAGRIDAVVADSLAMSDFLKTPTGACCENAGNVEDDTVILGNGVGFGLRKGDPLKDKLNAAIAAVRADGTYDTITKKYFSFDIYGKK
jgi:polar amino acid transport system substrate-binding protein